MDTVTLYELGAELNELQDQLVANDGELTPELEKKLDDLDLAFKVKAERVAKMVRILNARAQVVTSEVDRLKALAKTRSDASKSLKDYLLRWMIATNHKKVDTDLFTIAVQKNGRPSIHFDGDAENLPIPLRRTTIELDKKAALEAHKEGIKLPDSITVTQGFHLRIR